MFYRSRHFLFALPKLLDWAHFGKGAHSAGGIIDIFTAIGRVQKRVLLTSEFRKSHDLQQSTGCGQWEYKMDVRPRDAVKWVQKAKRTVRNTTWMTLIVNNNYRRNTYVKTRNVQPTKVALNSKSTQWFSWKILVQVTSSAACAAVLVWSMEAFRECSVCTLHGLYKLYTRPCGTLYIICATRRAL